MIWITGYVGSGKSTIAKKHKNVFEFDNIEIMLKKEGYNLKVISDKDYNKLVKMYLDKSKINIIEGIQAYQYYKKGDKVYFVKPGFFKSLKQAKNRGDKSKLKMDIIDNIKLFFILKYFYLRVKINHDIIKEI